DHVEIPRRWTGAGRAVFRREGRATHACGPTLVRIPPGKSEERRAIGDADRPTLENEVDAGERDGEGAFRVRCQISTLAGARAAHEVDLPVDPQRAHASNVRAAAGPRRG